MQYDAVLFDLDGTLTESEPGIINSVKYALDKMGVAPLSEEKLRSFIGPPLKASFMEQAGMDDAQAERAVEVYRERFSVVGWKENSVYPGVQRLLRTLKKEGTYVAVATSKPQKFSEWIVEYFGLQPWIDRVVGIGLDNHNADKKQIIREALPEKYVRACMVGDRFYDLEGGRVNGIDVAAVLYGYGSVEEYAPFAPDCVAQTVDELYDFLLGDAQPARGRFFTFEGPDGCGKSTQLELVAGWLRECGFEVVQTREPGGTPIAERIRELLLDKNNAEMSDMCEVLLYAAARAQHVEELILPALDAGKLVLSDRYVDSNVVYQGAGRQLGMDRIKQINDYAIQGLLPDYTLLFDIDPDQAMQRRKAASEPDRIELQGQEFMRRVYEGYQRLLGQERERMERINATGGVEEIQATVREVLNRELMKS